MESSSAPVSRRMLAAALGIVTLATVVSILTIGFAYLYTIDRDSNNGDTANAADAFAAFAEVSSAKGVSAKDGVIAGDGVSAAGVVSSAKYFPALGLLYTVPVTTLIASTGAYLAARRHFSTDDDRQSTSDTASPPPKEVIREKLHNPGATKATATAHDVGQPNDPTRRKFPLRLFSPSLSTIYEENANALKSENDNDGHSGLQTAGKGPVDVVNEKLHNPGDDVEQQNEPLPGGGQKHGSAITVGKRVEVDPDPTHASQRKFPLRLFSPSLSTIYEEDEPAGPAVEVTHEKLGESKEKAKSASKKLREKMQNTFKDIQRSMEKVRPNVKAEPQKAAKRVQTANQKAVKHVQAVKQKPVKHVQAANQKPVKHVQAANQKAVKHVQAVKQKPVKHVQAANQKPVKHVQAVKQKPVKHVQAANQKAVKHVQAVKQKVVKNVKAVKKKVSELLQHNSFGERKTETSTASTLDDVGQLSELITTRYAPYAPKTMENDNTEAHRNGVNYATTEDHSKQYSYVSPGGSRHLRRRMARRIKGLCTTRVGRCFRRCGDRNDDTLIPLINADAKKEDENCGSNDIHRVLSQIDDDNSFNENDNGGNDDDTFRLIAAKRKKVPVAVKIKEIITKIKEKAKSASKELKKKMQNTSKVIKTSMRKVPKNVKAAKKKAAKTLKAAKRKVSHRVKTAKNKAVDAVESVAENLCSESDSGVVRECENMLFRAKRSVVHGYQRFY